MIRFKFEKGMFLLVVKIFAAPEPMRSNRPLYERHIQVNDSVEIDYGGLMKTFRFLYGLKVIIVFECHPIE